MGISLGIAVKPFNRLYVLRLGCPFVSGYGFRVGEVPFPGYLQVQMVSPSHRFSCPFVGP